MTLQYVRIEDLRRAHARQDLPWLRFVARLCLDGAITTRLALRAVRVGA